MVQIKGHLVSEPKWFRSGGTVSTSGATGTAQTWTQAQYGSSEATSHLMREVSSKTAQVLSKTAQTSKLMEKDYGSLEIIV